MKIRSLKKQGGFTIVELTITITIVVLISTVLLYKGRDIYEWYKIWRITEQVTDVQKAANGKNSDLGTFTNISQAQIASYVPKGFTWVNTYGGNVDVKPGTQSYEFLVTTANIPNSVGIKIADKYPNNAVYDAGTLTVTFTFGI